MQMKTCGMELSHILRSSKIIVFAMTLIFLNMQIVVPLRECSGRMDMKMSFLEPYLAIGNSAMVILILPLLFMTIMAEFPREGRVMYFYHIRTCKRNFVVSQLMLGAVCAVGLTMFVLVGSIVLSIDFVEPNYEYSDAVTKYVVTFPEYKDSYAANLIPKNLYNHFSLTNATIHTFLLMILYLMLLMTVIVLFTVLNKKIIGFITDIFLVAIGGITWFLKTKLTWIVPMAHTIPWSHFYAYEKKEIVPIATSYVYLIGLNLALGFLAVLLSKRYNVD